MASSDSSDNEELERLKEAADSQFINDAMFNKTNRKESPPLPTEKPREDSNLPSLRPNRDEVDPQMNFFHVTEEFQRHASKHLTALLDQQIEYIQIKAPIRRKRKKIKSAVKLLRSSEVFIDNTTDISSEALVNGNTEKTTNRKCFEIKRRCIEADNIDNDDETKLKNIAVSAEDILSQKDVKNWSNRSKAPVFKYKKTKSGQLELVEEFK